MRYHTTPGALVVIFDVTTGIASDQGLVQLGSEL
jgi:hypothetical protein